MYAQRDYILKDDWKAKGQKSGGLAHYLNTVANMLNNFVIMSGGSLEKTADGMTLRCSGSSFSGDYVFKGKLYSLTGDRKNYWFHNAAKGAGAWSDGPMPDPMPENIYMRKTSTCRSIEYILC